MANTYTLINSTSLSTTAASVTFSAIPATYDDLVLRISARTDNASAVNNMRIQLNSDTSTNYSETFVRGNGSTAASNRTTSDTKWIEGLVQSGASATSNTFGFNEIYIPSYRVSQNKPCSIDGVQEDNSTTGRYYASAALWRNTAAITSIYIEAGATVNFVSGSTFWLYGIKNS